MSSGVGLNAILTGAAVLNQVCAELQAGIGIGVPASIALAKILQNRVW